MKIDRRVTNGLAWAGVLLVVGVPTADLLSAQFMGEPGAGARRHRSPSSERVAPVPAPLSQRPAAPVAKPDVQVAAVAPAKPAAPVVLPRRPSPPSRSRWLRPPSPAAAAPCRHRAQADARQHLAQFRQAAAELYHRRAAARPGRRHAGPSADRHRAGYGRSRAAHRSDPGRLDRAAKGRTGADAAVDAAASGRRDAGRRGAAAQRPDRRRRPAMARVRPPMSRRTTSKIGKAAHCPSSWRSARRRPGRARAIRSMTRTAFSSMRARTASRGGAIA